MFTKQVTFNVPLNDGSIDKIICKARQRTYVRNPNGFYVFVNGERFYSNHLEVDKAIESCYVKWVQKYR